MLLRMAAVLKRFPRTSTTTQQSLSMLTHLAPAAVHVANWSCLASRLARASNRQAPILFFPDLFSGALALEETDYNPIAVGDPSVATGCFPSQPNIDGSRLPREPMTGGDGRAGQIRGTVTLVATGQPIPGATVVLTGGGLREDVVQTTDEAGRYVISHAGPARGYVLHFYYRGAMAEIDGLDVIAATRVMADVRLSADTEP